MEATASTRSPSMWYSLQPEQRVGDQERADLVAAVVEDQRAPVAMLALARVGMLVERGAVEEDEAVRILGEMRGHPVDDHADAVPGGSASTKYLKSSGVPKREVGAK